MKPKKQKRVVGRIPIPVRRMGTETFGDKRKKRARAKLREEIRREADDR